MQTTYDLMAGFVGAPSGEVEHTLLYACACVVSLLLVWFVPWVIWVLATGTKRLSD